MTALADAFGRRHTTLRLGLTERCNLRCVYCMPAQGVPLTPTRAMLATDEIEAVARALVGAGVDKVRLTGGEPLVRKDAVEVAERLGRLGLRSLAMTTNGLLLEDRLPALRAAGLTDLTVSLDTLRADRFHRVTRRDGLGTVLGALAAALEAGYAIDGPRSLKVNVVALRGVNEDEAADFAALSVREPVEVRFIEVMPFDGNGWDRAALVPMAETRAAIEAVHGPLVPRDDGPHATARTFNRPGWRGRVGFVASMTAPFCAGCNRLRVTADGALKVCLFGAREVSLRDALRAGATDADVVALVRRALAGKARAHAGMDVLAATGNRPMITIGG
ncbi:GTP 3',8-cyclase MoaA [Rubrivirga sp.]|uniref:GTP 3',8-cyclase MoaA n=1 Tax=Rubrivirga sp. TaxID=1885344 RepID=UPI003B51E3B1